VPQFYASSSKGLSEALATELKNLGLEVTETDTFGVKFESNWEGCFKANLCSRLATRISLPVLEFPAYNPDEVYDNVMKHDFTRYLSPEQTLMVHSTVKESSIRDQRILALKVKDAIVDQFRKKHDRRPDVNKDTPDTVFSIFGFKNNFHLSVDTSGAPLTRRGYRKSVVTAPLREHLASGILELTGWDRNTPIVDPMCGSGTFLIEAALMATNVMPGTFRDKFSWQHFSHVDKSPWDGLLEKTLEDESEELDFKFYGFDTDWDALDAAQKNAKRAGVDHLIEFQKCDIRELERPEVENGMIVTNPPYGIRLGDEHFLDELYKDFAFQMKQQFAGWDMWLLSGNAELTRNLKMKATQKMPIMNGNLDCRLINYKILKTR